MTRPVKPVTPLSLAVYATGADAPAEWDSMDQVRGDCARMVPHWRSEHRTPPAPGSASELHGISVPAACTALLDGTSEYGASPSRP
ncbi:hypothetical protein [Streptomyces sp. NPDC003077]|uniref:hypothetical protein n=1 Tax=Streptomyces sp. NPDC003077 TaxID=3154443 RepID=UPI0033A941F3